MAEKTPEQLREMAFKEAIDFLEEISDKQWNEDVYTRQQAGGVLKHIRSLLATAEEREKASVS